MKTGTMNALSTGTVVSWLAWSEGGHPHSIQTSDSGNAIEPSKISHTIVSAPLAGKVVEVLFPLGAYVAAGDELLVLESMKMEHVVLAPASGRLTHLACDAGAVLVEGSPMAAISLPESATTTDLSSTVISTTDALSSDPATARYSENNAVAAQHTCTAQESSNLTAIRADLLELQQRCALGTDALRVEATAKRHAMGAQGSRTARENIADLCDEGSFREYGGLAIAAQRKRRSLDYLLKNTPADGLVAGVGSVNGELFNSGASNSKIDDPVRTQCIVMSYDYMVLAGTQGLQNHRKKDRMFELAEKQRLPIILFGEGGGGRPGDTDTSQIAGLDCMAFSLYARLSGLVPRIAIAHGRCFAGNAALVGCSDVVIATETCSLGMGGPAMIEGGGLGRYRPEEVGPMSVQVPNGVVDVLVKDEAEAVAVAKRYLSYFQGRLPKGKGMMLQQGGDGGTNSDDDCITADKPIAADQRTLRNIVPENRLRVYDVRRVLHSVMDQDSVLELRGGFGIGAITALARVDGESVGVIANNPAHLSGALDSDAADKIARFMQMCDAFALPIVSICDTPGIMVGPEVEKTALVRHAARLFTTAASLSVPVFTVVLRKGYGLGAMAMAGGSFKASSFTVAWPTAEFGGMGLEGAVRLGFRKELEAITDDAEREQAFKRYVDKLYAHGKAVNYATAFEIDSVIDPADTRKWLVTGLQSIPTHSQRMELGKYNDGKRRPCIDTW